MLCVPVLRKENQVFFRESYAVPPRAGIVSAQLSTASRVSSFSKPLTSIYSLVMVTVKVSSPREQEYFALQVSSAASLDAEPPTPAAVSAASVPVRRDAMSVYAVLSAA